MKFLTILSSSLVLLSSLSQAAPAPEPRLIDKPTQFYTSGEAAKARKAYYNTIRHNLKLKKAKAAKAAAAQLQMVKEQAICQKTLQKKNLNRHKLGLPIFQNYEEAIAAGQMVDSGCFRLPKNLIFGDDQS